MADLLRLFEYYLAATLGLYLLQAAAQVELYRAVLRAPTRWPTLSRLLLGNARLLLTVNLVALAGLTVSLWIAWILLRNLVWPGTELAPEILLAQPVLAAAALLVGAIVIGLDARSLLRFQRRLSPRTERLLGLTEWVIRHDPSRATLALTSFRLRWWLGTRAPHAQRWIILRLLEISSRLALGTLLWAAARSPL